MKKIQRILSALSAAVIAASLIPTAAYAEERVTPSGIAFSDIGAKITEYVSKQCYPSYRVGVFCGDEVIYEGGSGHIDKENDILTDADTVYEWGSTTKIITWVSVMQLYEQGRIDLETDVREYLPDDFVKRLRYKMPITMIDLMNHTPGFEETSRNISTEDAGSVRSLAESLIDSEPEQVFRPGEITAYSNWGAALAGYVVQCISGEDFTDYVHKHIFEPAGMEHTSIAPDHGDNAWVKEQREKVYSYKMLEMDGDKIFIPVGRMLCYIEPFPAGAAAGTIGDLVKFGQALVSDNCPFFEKQETADLMFSATSYFGDTDIPKNCHGLWPVQGRVMYIGHNGATNGFSANLEFNRETKLGCAVLVNQYAESAITDGIPALLFGELDMDKYKDCATVPVDISGTYLLSRSQFSNSLKAFTCLNTIKIKKTDDGEFTLGGEERLRPIDNRLVLISAGEGGTVIEMSADGKRLGLGSAEIIKTDDVMLLHILVYVYIGLAAAGFIAVMVIWIMWILRKRRKLRGVLPICASNLAKVVSCLSYLAMMLVFNADMGLRINTGIFFAVIQTICVILYALSAVSDTVMLVKRAGGKASKAVYSVDMAANVAAVAIAFAFNLCIF